ncbi:hypothetical protein [Microbacterium thalassium]|uniref:Uncharacterized protein n=1 Tax=Microbacterium thalassium TaxID=362649 RepID=A0A7X0FS39_9MICO|nr:hypothetical protein [Microbacterium thalassium]MBB6392693.1 hypothetical protein [Microbacterium thalassium]
MRTKHTDPAHPVAELFDLPIAESDLADAVRAACVDRGWHDEWADDVAEAHLGARVRGAGRV